MSSDLMIIGIDFSLTCPSMCFHYIYPEKEWSHHNCAWIFVNDTKKYNLEIEDPGITGISYPDWKTPEERFDKITDILTSHIPTNSVVYLEGYSFASKGLIFDIAECTGLFKHKLYKNNIPVITVPPTTNKKFATKKGNADKILMYESFIQETNINMEGVMNSRKDKNPISDIVDSYYLCKYGFHQEQSKFNI